MAQEDRLRRIAPAVRITRHDSCTELYFPPLRAPGSVLLLGLFGISSVLIGGAAISGLLHSSQTAAANFIALAFAGVFALPLVALGLWFIAFAVWTAGNAMTVEVRNAGIRVTRRICGYRFARHQMRSEELTALDLVTAPRYVSALGSERYYRIRARANSSEIIVTDSLAPASAAELRRLMAEILQRPELAAGDSERKDKSG